MRLSIIIILVVMTLMIITPVSASFSTVFSTIDNTILPNETAQYQLTISNFDKVKDRFQIYTIDPNWIVDVEPFPIVVNKEDSVTFNISLKPKSTAGIGSQGVTINIKNVETKNVVKKDLLVSIRSFDSTIGVFAASVFFDMSLLTKINPKNPIQLMVRLRNRNALNINDLDLKITSPHFNKDVELNLTPLGELTNYYTFNIDHYEKPGNYTINGLITYKGKKVSELSKEYSIEGYSDIKTTELVDNSFLKTVKTIKVFNDGNEKGFINVSSPVNFFKSIFTTTDVDYNESYVWNLVVYPKKTIEINITTNYRLFVLLILLIILGIIYYYYNRSPVIGVKEVIGIKRGEGVSDIKIRLFIKNRSNKMIRGVEVIDKVPSIAHLTKTHTLGTIQPTKLTRLKSGVLLRYELDILEPYEERVITYAIESKLKIIGRVSLPKSKILFKTRDNKDRVVFTENVQLLEK